MWFVMYIVYWSFCLVCCVSLALEVCDYMHLVCIAWAHLYSWAKYTYILHMCRAESSPKTCAWICTWNAQSTRPIFFCSVLWHLIVLQFPVPSPRVPLRSPRRPWCSQVRYLSALPIVLSAPPLCQLYSKLIPCSWVLLLTSYAICWFWSVLCILYTLYSYLSI